MKGFLVTVGGLFLALAALSASRSLFQKAEPNQNPGKATDLRGKPPAVGQVFRYSKKLTVRGGKAILNANGLIHNGTFDAARESVDEGHILGVTDRRVTREQIKVLTDQTALQIVAGGDKIDRLEKGQLLGETLVREKVGKEWKFTLKDKAPTPSQEFHLKDQFEPVWEDGFFPGVPVKPGHSWDVDLKKLRRPYGFDNIDSGSWKITFDRVAGPADDARVFLTEEIHLRGTARDEFGQITHREWKLKGTTERSLRLGVNLSTRLTGTLTVKERSHLGGVERHLTLTGPVTVEMATARVEEKGNPGPK